MMKKWSCSLFLASLSSAITLHRSTPFPLLNFKVESIEQSTPLQIPFASGLPKGVSEHYFEQVLDHGDVESNATFGMRYWKSERYYRPGGPIIALLGGETSGTDRLDFLSSGIVDILTKATHGLGVIVEHRYYGDSIPVPDFSTENLRWLTTSLALEDNVYFSRNVDLGYGNATSSHQTPWIWYGGSYAGAQAAFLKHLYPEDVYGAIASSGVVHAQINFWEYFEPIRVNMPPLCSKSLTEAVEYLDTSLMLRQPQLTTAIKHMFGLPELKDDRDFMNALTIPLGYWQQQQWTEPVNELLGFCSSLTNGVRSDESTASTLQKVLLNYAGYIKANVTQQCTTSIEECFSSSVDIMSSTDSIIKRYDLSQTWRLWLFQVCTEWGYHMPAPPPSIPSIISRLLDLEYVSSICRIAYNDASHLIPAWPEVDKVNKYGDFGIGSGRDADHRIMIVDGSSDPWLYATAHSPYSNLNRIDSVDRPFKLIDGGFHHSDEYGAKHEPSEISAIHADQVATVKAWLREKSD